VSWKKGIGEFVCDFEHCVDDYVNKVKCGYIVNANEKTNNLNKVKTNNLSNIYAMTHIFFIWSKN
jgi:hypothetical protein